MIEDIRASAVDGVDSPERRVKASRMEVAMARDQFHRQITQLLDGVIEMGSMVDRATERAMTALVERDAAAAREVVEHDADINQLNFHLQNSCISLLSLQAPMAGDLRVIVSVTSVLDNLERMGDHAEGIAKIVLMMQDEPLVKPLIDLPIMATKAREMLRLAVQSFVDRNPEAAYGVGRMDDIVDQLYEQIYADLIQIMVGDPSTIEPATHLLWCAHNLERIGDRATNIAERTVYAATGMMPQMDVSSY